MSHGYFKKMEDEENKAFSVVLQTFQRLEADGIGGRPLVMSLPGGGVRLNVMLSLVGDDTVYLVPVELVHPSSFVPVATLPGLYGTTTYLVSGGRSFSAAVGRSVYPSIFADRIGDGPGVLGAYLLGADPRDFGGDIWKYPLGRIRSHEHPTVRVRRLNEFEGYLPPVLTCGGTIPSELIEAALGLANEWAVIDGQVLHVDSFVPHWQVVVNDNGRVTVKADTWSARRSASEPLTLSFHLNRLGSARAYAAALAAIHPEGRVVEDLGASIHDADASIFDASEQNASDQARSLVRMVEYLPGHLPPNAIPCLMRLDGIVGKDERHSRHPPEEGWLNSVRSQWEATSRALGDLNKLPSALPSKGMNSADRTLHRWALRFRLSREALDLLLLNPPGDLPSPESGRGSEKDISESGALSVAFDVAQVDGALKEMSGLLLTGGAQFAGTWAGCREAIEAYISTATVETSRVLEDSVLAMSDAIPEEFPSAPAAGRWAMRSRPVIRKAAAAVSRGRTDG